MVPSTKTSSIFASAKPPPGPTKTKATTPLTAHKLTQTRSTKQLDSLEYHSNICSNSSSSTASWSLPTIPYRAREFQGLALRIRASKGVMLLEIEIISWKGHTMLEIRYGYSFLLCLFGYQIWVQNCDTRHNIHWNLCRDQWLVP